MGAIVPNAESYCVPAAYPGHRVAWLLPARGRAAYLLDGCNLLGDFYFSMIDYYNRRLRTE